MREMVAVAVHVGVISTRKKFIYKRENALSERRKNGLIY